MRSRAFPTRAATTVMLIVVLMVVAAALSAAATVLARHHLAAPERPESVPCGTSTCINLKFDEVITVLKDHGYTCASLGGQWTRCGLTVGITRFEFAAQPNSGLIQRLGASVKIRDDAVPLADKAIAFVQWVASLPVPADAASITQVHTWVKDRITARRKTEATINGYKYTLTPAGAGLDLDIYYDIGGKR